MKSTPLNSSFQCASFEPKKILPRFFRLREIQKNKKTQKNSYFWLPRQQMGSMTGTFPMPEFKSSYTITHRNFVRIGDKFFSKKPCTPPFYRICTPKKHLNGHSSLIKHNMTMKSTPLDSSFQCASFEPKKFYLAFFV
jgi:hypothetical protein